MTITMEYGVSEYVCSLATMEYTKVWSDVRVPRGVATKPPCILMPERWADMQSVG